MVFDIEIDSTDVNTADIIRKKLQDFGGDSEGHRRTNRNEKEILSAQRDIRQNIFKYIFRKRQDVKPIKVSSKILQFRLISGNIVDYFDFFLEILSLILEIRNWRQKPE